MNHKKSQKSLRDFIFNIIALKHLALVPGGEKTEVGNDKTKKQLFDMANELYTFRDFLEGNTLYLTAMRDRDGKTLLYWANRKLDMAKKEWKTIREQAQVDKQSR